MLRVSFVIVGFDIPHSEISILMECLPDDAAQSNDQKISSSGRSFIVKDSYWEIQDTSHSLMIDERMINLLDRMPGANQGIPLLPNDAVCKFDISLSIDSKESLPGMYLDKDLLKRLYELEIEIDFDIG